MDVTQRIFTVNMNFAICSQCCLFPASDMDSDNVLKLIPPTPQPYPVSVTGLASMVTRTYDRVT